MNAQLLALTLSIFAAWATIAGFYRLTVHRVWSSAIKYRLFAKRDKLRRLAIEGQVSAESFEYKYLEEVLCELIRNAHKFSFGSLIRSKIAYQTFQPTEEMNRFDTSADLALKKLENDALGDVFSLLAVNSPGWALIGFVLFVADKCGLKIRIKQAAKILAEKDIRVSEYSSPSYAYGI